MYTKNMKRYIDKIVLVIPILFLLWLSYVIYSSFGDTCIKIQKQDANITYNIDVCTNKKEFIEIIKKEITEIKSIKNKKVLLEIKKSYGYFVYDQTVVLTINKGEIKNLKTFFHTFTTTMKLDSEVKLFDLFKEKETSLKTLNEIIISKIKTKYREKIKKRMKNEKWNFYNSFILEKENLVILFDSGEIGSGFQIIKIPWKYLRYIIKDFYIQNSDYFFELNCLENGGKSLLPKYKECENLPKKFCRGLYLAKEPTCRHSKTIETCRKNCWEIKKTTYKEKCFQKCESQIVNICKDSYISVCIGR